MSSLREDLPPRRIPASLERARFYSNCATFHQKSRESAELASMQRQVVDALTVTLPTFVRIAASDAQVWRLCEIFLRTYQQGWTVTFSFSFLLLGVQSKEEQTNWNISAPLHSVLVEISHLADERLNPESKRAGDLSSSLIHSPPTVLASSKTIAVATPNSRYPPTC
ncbi:hypothetical protein BGW80DRAFT_1511960 [Lactifluus volemus]|nr:hypothetical protein BGW80DRAFT_1511960 [Lactifluus volemus]